MPDDRAPSARPDATGTEDTIVATADQATAPVVPPISATDQTVASDSAGGTTGSGDDLPSVALSRFGVVAHDRFEVLGELARGGLGRVLRARDPRTGRIVALKEVLRPSADLLARFGREALVTANLQHPAIIPVYEVGHWPTGAPFYAMKLVQGRALDELIAEARTAAARIALVPHVIAIADALAYAHSEHVIHRDLKPGNVLVGAYGETVVIDWGLARNLAAGAESEAPGASSPPAAQGGAASASAASAPGETVAGAVMGTPAYMPPEQARGQVVDERADVYAIGAILYHVLAGVRPYAERHTLDAVLREVEAGPPRPLVELAADVPAELVAIVTKAMARAPAERYPTAAGLADDLRRYQAGQLVGAHQYSPWHLVRRWLARRRGAVGTAAVALCALAVFGAVSVRRIAAERDEARRQHARAEEARAAAQSSRQLAERRFADSLEELGRQAALDGAPDRALAFLVGARAAQPEARPVLAFLLGRARDAFAGLRAIVPAPPEGTVSADVTPDGRRVIATSSAQELHAWDVGAVVPAWTATAVHRIAVSPDGAWVLGVGLDGAVSVRAVADGRVARQWHRAGAASEQVVVLGWAPDSAHFAIGTTAGRVVLGARDADALRSGAGHDGEVHALRYSPDGGRVTSCGPDGALLVHDATTAATVARLVEGTRPLADCAWIDDGRVVTGDDSGAVRVWRVAARTVERRLAHGPDLYGLAVGRAGAATWLVTFGDGATAVLWDLDAGVPRARLGGHRIAVNGAVAVGPWLVTADETGGLFTWDPRTGDALAPLPSEGPVVLVVKGEHLLTFGEGRTRLWALAPETAVRRLGGHTARVRDLQFDRASATVWSASNDGSARGVDVATGVARVLGQADFAEAVVRDPAQAGGQAPNPHGLRSLALSPDGRLVATTGEDGTIRLWDAARGVPRATWRGHRGRVRRVVFARDGATAFSVGDATLRRWDVATGRELGRVELGEVGWDVALVGDDRVATLTDETRTVALWDAATLAARPAPEVAHDGLRELVVLGERLVVASAGQLLALDAAGHVAARAVHGQAFAADVAPGGATIAVGNARGEVVLHAAETLAPVRSWPTSDVVVAAVRFRPDGAVLATGGGRHVRLWDPATGRAIAITPELPATITQLAWSPDGRWLAFGGGSGTVWLWDLADGGADLAAFARCVSPWRLDDSALAAAGFDPAACPRM